VALHMVGKKGNRIPPVTNQSPQGGSSLCVDVNKGNVLIEDVLGADNRIGPGKRRSVREPLRAAQPTADHEIPAAMPTSQDRSRNLMGRNSLFGGLFRRELCILLITPEGVPSSLTFV